MTYPSETAMNHMAAEDESDMPETGMPATDMVETDTPETDTPETDMVETDMVETDTPETDMPETDMPETDMPETDMLQRVPAPAEPLPTETPAFPTDMLEHVPAPAEPLPTETPAFPAASATASLSARWHEILATFVDDPRSSAEMAADLVDESVQALVASVKEQQDSLLAAWHGENASTEELRTAVQHYRAFGGRLADLTSES